MGDYIKDCILMIAIALLFFVVLNYAGTLEVLIGGV
jgi:hypothetical protein